jgi:hypothetical protein
MREISRSGHKRALYGSILICALLAVILATVWPCSVGGAVEGMDERFPDFALGSGLFKELGSSRPYYSPEVAATFDPEAESLKERTTNRVPAELLPESLLPEGKIGGKAEGGEFNAAGAGGWIPLSRPYAPSPDPDISYWTGSYGQIMDNSGRLHVVYEQQVRTDITQLPDPGPHYEWLTDINYSMYYEGSWTPPVSLTNVSGFEDSTLLFINADSEGYLHIVYSKWTWGIDPNSANYQHENENSWYRYRAPGGTWSAPRQLTNYTGSWGLLGADFVMRNGRLYGTFVTIRNNETLPASYRAQAGYIEGSMDDWEPMAQLSAWNYDITPGQQIPIYWPSIAVSWLGEEVMVAYGVQTYSGVATDLRSNIYAAVRDTGGAWSGPHNITSAAANQFWLPMFVFYRNDSNRATVFSYQFVNFTGDIAHPPRNNFQLIYHDGGGWSVPVNVTRVASPQDGQLVDIELDPFQNLHFTYSVITYAWTGAAWEQRGGSLEYTRETDAGLSGIVTILGYSLRKYPADALMIIDNDGNVRIVFTTVMYDGAATWDWNVNYVDNAPGGDPTTFNAVEQIRPNTNYEIYELNLSGFPDGDVLASWFEKGFAGARPVWGRMFSRYRDGSTWQGTVPVSMVPGSADILHVLPAGWLSFETVEIADTGEQHCVFETAKYNPGPGVYYDFRKYFTETVNGVWTTPELISPAGISGENPAFYIDGGQRYFVLYGTTDAATGKEVLYGTQQREPTAPASTYYFAEGTTRPGFDEWICIQNSGDADANVTLTYMLETGANIENTLLVPAHSRSTVNVNAAVGPDHDVSARVTADRFIVAERPMYFDYYDWTGGHCTVGARETSRLWYFAEGTTRSGFEEYLTIQNPSDRDARVAITYVLGNGTTVPAEAYVGARSRATVNVNAAVGPEQDVSMVVECDDVAIVAERPMYFNYRGLTGGHCVMGSNSLDTQWYFAEGTTRNGFDTYICLQNPYNVDATASLTFILGDGSTVVQPMLIPATSRQTLRVNDAIGPDRDVSTVVESDSLLLAERPMYFNYSGGWPGGHVATGARNPKNYWFFAEGTTRAGFVEWLCLQNPGPIDATATLSFMLEDGTVQDNDVAVPAHTRVTVAVPNFIGPDRDISVAVGCDQAIVVERPMYFLYHNVWPGGHVVVGL